MAFYNIASSINLTILATIIFFYTASNASTSVANVTSQPSSLQLEGKALLDSGWWKSCSNISSLHRHEISDRIPPQLGALTKLRWCHPPEIGNMSSLQILDVGGNILDGLMPKELGQLKDLVTLDLSDNRLIGSIPSSLCHLINLQKLTLSRNQINDSIPLGLGNLKFLITLDLGDNNLFGPIPLSLASSANLKEVFLAQNRISGSIPSNLGDLKILLLLDGLHEQSKRFNSPIPGTID
ncbi:hypothetical protein GH714_031945 [Hevea brasiliensis]|uniref:Leucine-rich repeat-containing N-terminal plant-type domain-containing protein n=1 Tax=Hevea brasiliensis TaxID=3981 RepID=A0A6A6N6H6_HEVBR|nr:hypothetical protein GH714_031945 [Hevea brasiliensis]